MRNILFILLFSFSFSQVSNITIYSAHSAALAGANAINKNFTWAIFENPASLVNLRGTSVSIGQSRLYGYSWLPLYSGVVNTTLPIIGQFSIASMSLQTKNSGVELSSESLFSFGKGFQLQQDANSSLSMGFTSSYIVYSQGKSAGSNGDGSNGIELGDVSAITIDIGAIGTLRNRYSFGVMLKNLSASSIGEGLSSQSLPQRFNAGVTYSPQQELSTTIMLEKLLGVDAIVIKGSVDYKINSMLNLHIGAQANPNRFGSGFSFNVGGQSFTYGLITHPVLPISHYVNIGLNIFD